MHIILGATGHVGSVVARTLLDRGEPVTVVTRDAHRVEPLARRGADVAVVDVRDADALRAVLRRGTRAFLLMPPADPAGDTVAEEQRTVESIAGAVDGAGLEHVVVESTYGAQPGVGIGDLGVLYAFEEAIRALGVRASVIRAAYYMSNWDSALDAARTEGTVHSLYPVDFLLPMVAPADLGHVAARLLAEQPDDDGVHYVEGPRPYSAADVAAAFAAALGRDVRAVETPRDRWVSSFEEMGYSPAAAASYARMTALTLDGSSRPAASERGPTTLDQYVAALARRPSHR